MKRFALGLALAIAAGGSAPAAAAVQVPDGFEDQVLASSLDAPTSLAFLPDGRLLVTEQNTGRVRLFVNGHVLANPVLTVPNLAGEGERGLLGIAVDPRWPAYPFVYLNYTRTGDRQRIVRYLASDDVDDPTGENLTFSAPRILIDDIRDEFGNHNAGCLRFGPDDHLYVSLGDDAVHCDAGDSTSLRGQILRLRIDGLPIYGGPEVPRAMITPSDNPYVASPDSNARLVYAFGLRNPFRFHIDLLIGTLYVGDVGENQLEELSEVSAGDFLGWPWLEGSYARPRPECPEPGGTGAKPSKLPIALISRNDPIGYAIISAGMYRPVLGGTSNWPPSYYPIRGDVFYGQYYAGFLRRLTWNGTSWQPAAPVAGQPNSTDWATGMLNSVDFQVGPDGGLWWLQQYNPLYEEVSGAIHRVVYTGSPTSVDPRAIAARALRASPNPSRGRVELAFALGAPAGVRLAVYDLVGRRVREVFEGDLQAGDHRLAWDGRDDRGGEAGPGVYFARMERAGSPTVTARVLRLH